MLIESFQYNNLGTKTKLLNQSQKALSLAITVHEVKEQMTDGQTDERTADPQ